MHLELSVEVQTSSHRRGYNLTINGTNSAVLLICCQTTKVMHVHELAIQFIQTPGDIVIGIVELYHSNLDKVNQEEILRDFANLAGQIRISL